MLVQDVADALEIHPFMLSKWRKQVREGLIKVRVSIAPDARTQREVRQLARLKSQYSVTARPLTTSGSRHEYHPMECQRNRVNIPRYVGALRLVLASMRYVPRRLSG